MRDQNPMSPMVQRLMQYLALDEQHKRVQGMDRMMEARIMEGLLPQLPMADVMGAGGKIRELLRLEPQSQEPQIPDELMQIFKQLQQQTK